MGRGSFLLEECGAWCCCSRVWGWVVVCSRVWGVSRVAGLWGVVK